MKINIDIEEQRTGFTVVAKPNGKYDDKEAYAVSDLTDLLQLIEDIYNNPHAHFPKALEEERSMM